MITAREAIIVQTILKAILKMSDEINSFYDECNAKQIYPPTKGAHVKVPMLSTMKPPTGGRQ